MIVTVNGEAREVADGATVAMLVELLADGASSRGVAVAVHGEVVARSAWDTTQLANGDRVEVVAAIQGG
jgi:thiamine biosynthesis protein ThiS